MTKAKTSTLKASDVKAVVASEPSITGTYVFLVRTCVRLHRMIDGKRHSRDIVNTSVHAHQPTAESILAATREDPIKHNMHERTAYFSKLADCLHTFGVPDVTRANDESGKLAEYVAATVGCEWVAAIENDECGHSNDDKSLGYIAISQRIINP